MSVREYIGARYVPVFSDPIQWDNTKSYEPLTVVTNNGTSYVSRQSVPPGTAIDNESYWVRWADYNAQLEEYIRQVQTYSASISALNDALPIANFDDENTVKDAIDDLGALLPGTDFTAENTVKDAIDGLSALLPGSTFDSVNTVDARFDAIEAKFPVATADIANTSVTTDKIANNAVTPDKIAKSNFVLFGDSWADFTAGFENWYSANNFGGILHCNLINFAKGGAGFTGGSSLISAQITQAAGEMTTAEKNNTKYVCVVGGINDISNANPGVASDNVWYSAVNNILETAATMFPNAKIVYAPNCSARAHGAFKKAEMVRLSLTYKNVHIPYRNGPIIFAPNLPLFWTGHMDEEVFRTDNLHLNANGADAFGKQILSAFTGQNNEPIVGVTKIGNLTFFYDCYGNGNVTGTYSFDTTSQITISSTENALTNWSDAFYTYIAPTRIWTGISGTPGNNAWIRSIGSNTITARSEFTGTMYF